MAKPMTADQTIAAMKKWHVPYREWAGWKTRGRDPEHGPFSNVHGIVIHHTGSDAGQSDDYLDFLATRGRPGLPGPLCNVSTDMDGDLWLIAQGRANHAGSGSSVVLAHVANEDYAGYTSELKPGPDNIDGNAVYYGNEVRYDGGQPMTAKAYASATRWAAAVCDFHGWSALSIIGHREHTSRKNDPGNCPMNKFRADVAALLKAGPGGTPATKPPVTGGTSTPAKGLLQMELDDVVIAAQAATATTPAAPAVTVRDVLAADWWLTRGHGVGGKFEKLHANWKADGTKGPLAQQLQRIEDDTDNPTPA